MKRICAALLAALLLCGCGNAAKTPAESTAPEETVPVWTVAPDGNSTDVTCKGSYTGQGSENTVVARVGEKALTNGQLAVWYWAMADSGTSSVKLSLAIPSKAFSSI